METTDVLVHNRGVFAERKTLNDLVVQNEEREILWKNLRERAEHEQLYKTDLPRGGYPARGLMAFLLEAQDDYE